MKLDPKSITNFAQRVLLSPSLSDKLAAPNPFSDKYEANLSSIFKPDFRPARENSFGFTPSAKRSALRFPSKSALEMDSSRGAVLHFFANHELLALELMAFALLKWPEAPESFQIGLVQTMVEEQEHMQLYLNRMHDLGVHFGDLPLNDFFWRCLSPLNSPLEFVASMSLTFEQANLDFSFYYEQIFSKLGDHTSAQIMKKVRDDEIGHVKHGLIWFNRWRQGQESLFKEWSHALTFPITPARAKGLVFDQEGRKRSGLPEDFIHELAVHNQSKGRPPRVFWFSPTSEEEIVAGLNFTRNKAVDHLASDYAPLMGLLAKSDDIVLVQETPSVSHLTLLQNCGFVVPQYLPPSDRSLLEQRKIAEFCPWGWSPQAELEFEKFRKLMLSEQTVPTYHSNLPTQGIFSKAYGALLKKDLNLADCPDEIVRSLEELKSAAQKLASNSPTNQVALKSPYGASGRGILKINPEAISLTEERWILKTLDTQKALVVEPWLEKFTELSSHIQIPRSGDIQFIGFTRFWSNHRGQYRGHLLGRIWEPLGSSFLQKWHHPQNGWASSLKEASLRVGRKLQSLGYYGPLGIDSMIYNKEGELKLRMIQELNPRYSMGRLALQIEQRLSPKQCGFWIHLSKNALAKSGFESFTGWIESASKTLALDIRSNGDAKFIFSGVIPMNDPQLAKQSLAVLIVSSNYQECLEVLRKNGIQDLELESQINH